MVVSAEDDLILAGGCKTINRFKLSNSAPLREFRGVCRIGSFVFSRSLGQIVTQAHWNNDITGLIIYDSATGMTLDFIEIPDDLTFSKIDINPNGKDIAVLTPTSVWRVDLPSRTVKRLFGQLPRVRGARSTIQSRWPSTGNVLVRESC